MNPVHFSMPMAAGILAILVTVCSSAVEAKGYSAGPKFSNESEQQIKKRLSKVEQKQQEMQDAMAAELQRLRTEMETIKSQSTLNTSLATPK